MRPLFLLALSLLLAAPASAAELSPSARARAALALASHKPPQSVVRVPQSVLRTGCSCGCGCGADCRCVAGECGGAACACASNPRAKAKKKLDCGCGAVCNCQPGQQADTCGCDGCSCCRLTLSAAADKAIRENKPLILWINEVCPPCEKRMTGYVHCHLAKYEGDKDTVTEPSVIVFTLNSERKLIRRDTIPGIPEVWQIEQAQNISQQVSRVVPIRYAPPPMPMMMPMMGGFGGGGFGGGFGGGSGGGGC